MADFTLLSPEHQLLQAIPSARSHDCSRGAPTTAMSRTAVGTALCADGERCQVEREHLSRVPRCSPGLHGSKRAESRRAGGNATTRQPTAAHLREAARLRVVGGRRAAWGAEVVGNTQLASSSEAFDSPSRTWELARTSRDVSRLTRRQSGDNPVTAEQIEEVSSRHARGERPRIAWHRRLLPLADVAPVERARLLRALRGQGRSALEELAQIEVANSGTRSANARGRRQCARRPELLSPSPSASRRNTVGGGGDITFHEPIGVGASSGSELTIPCGGESPPPAAGTRVLSRREIPAAAIRIGEPRSRPAARVRDHGIPARGRSSASGSWATEVRRCAPRSTRRSRHGGLRRPGEGGDPRTRGKSANIVFADADVAGQQRCPTAVFDNAGQDCCAVPDLVDGRRTRVSRAPRQG